MSILIVIKQSKFDFDQGRLWLSDEGLIQKYKAEGVNPDVILESHYHQKQVSSWFQEIFSGEFFESFGTMKALHTLPLQIIDEIEYVIVVGGDNSFTLTSHVVNLPIIGVNSDPDRSSGHLLQWSVKTRNDVIRLLGVLMKGNYEIEEWTRLSATINGKKFAPATSEYFLGERRRTQMSRHVIEHKGKTYEQKCSGLLVATGVGCTGWIKSALKVPFAPLQKTTKRALFAATEMYNGDKPDGVIEQGEELVIHSLNDDSGCVSADSWDEAEFTRGAVARISLGKPLRVMVPNEV